MKNKNSKTLYLCYFGLRQPLVQTQVLPYLREIVKGDIRVHLLTFEQSPKVNWTKEDIEIERKKLASENIEWHFLTYHKTPSVPATLFDVLNGARFARKLAKKENLDIFHGRVHIPTMMAWLANKTLGMNKPKLLFDIRGFFPEEYVDAGIWRKDSKVFRAVKKAEKWLFRDADAFVTLTETGRDILFPESKKTGLDSQNRPVEVIPCCVDLDKFNLATAESRKEMRGKLGIENRFVVAYVGSFGGFYMTEETAEFYGTLKETKKNAFALILTQSEPDMIRKPLQRYGMKKEDYFIRKVSPAEIPIYLSAADAAVSLIKPSYSKQASSPTKNAEYLACGLPIVINDGIGDTTSLTLRDNTGTVLKDFSRKSYERAIAEIDKLLEQKSELEERCKKSARDHFDLVRVGGHRYRRIYNKIQESNR